MKIEASIGEGELALQLAAVLSGEAAPDRAWAVEGLDIGEVTIWIAGRIFRLSIEQIEE